MPLKFPRKTPEFLLLSAICVVFIVLVIFAVFRYLRPSSGNTYKIGVILSPAELPAGEFEDLKKIVAYKLETINEQGGIAGKELQVFYIDDQLNDKKLYEIVEKTSQDTSVIAYIGCRGVSRAQTIAPLLSQRKIPFIGLYVFTHLFQNYPTMYTASVGGQEAQKVFGELIKAKAKRIGFIGEKNDIQSATVNNILEQVVLENPGLQVTLSRFLPKGYLFDADKNRRLADSLRNENDFLVFISNTESFNSFVNFLHQEDLNIPVFSAGSPDLTLVNTNSPGFRTAELYHINQFAIPGAQNLRLLEQLQQSELSQQAISETIAQSNIAARISDEIGLLHEASQGTGLARIQNLRAKINEGLKQYINGNRVYRGWLADWYFTPEHAYAGETIIGWKPRKRIASVLAPYQYFHAGSVMKARPVLYTTLNLEEISQVNDDEGTFNATFYLEINAAEELDITTIDFTNAVRNEINHEPLVETKLIRSKRDTIRYNFFNSLYKISGKFMYEQDLRLYPLDKQKFPVSIQANNPDQVFLVQPTQKDLRDSIFESVGWIYKDQYMGFQQDIISTTTNFYGHKKNIPYYKFSYVFLMKRAPIDFFLKTLVPLLSIIIICYFSVYIPPREFEALAGVQVTGLLSSIALYFSTYKPEMQYATTSDKIFIFMYIMITTLIGSSILIYITHTRNSLTTRLMRVYQRFLFPVIVFAFTIYIRWF